MDTDTSSPERGQKQPFNPIRWPMIVVLTLLFVTVGWIVITELNDKAVTVFDGKEQIRFHTKQQTVAAALAEQGISVSHKDLVFPGRLAPLQEGQQIRIYRSFPVLLSIAGTTDIVFTTPCTVGELLSARQIQPGPLDRLNVPWDEIMAERREIHFVRVTEKNFTEQYPLAFETVNQPDGKMEKGFSQLVQNGKEGLGKTIIRVTYENGAEVSRQETEKRVVEAPVNQIVAYGTRDTAVVARGETIRFERALTMTATAYCACKKCTGKEPDHPWYGITRSGEKVRRGIVAVDPRVIPLGSRLYVEGYGYALAADIGSAIKGNRIDLYMETHQETNQFGRRRLKVYVLPK